jgi:cytochrome c oxidase subunit 2
LTIVKPLLKSVAANRSRLLMALLLVGMLTLLLGGCTTDTPQNTFDAKGEVADKQANLFYLAMWPAIVIMIGVLLGIVVLVLRFRERDPNQMPPKQTHGNTRLELAWTIAPAAFLLVLGVPMVAMIGDLDKEPEGAYVVDVVGQRYSWMFQYPEELDAEGNPLQVFVVSADDSAHIPAGREVLFRLRSVDVIHSFWIPKLGGKRDVFPCRVVEDENADPMDRPQCEGGQLNTLWLKADEPGSFSGQCAEYCGLEHANMKMTVVADSEADFESWVSEAGGDN